MRGRIAHKLRSEQGASMSMALLLFLVCAIVSSIVIGAASAAAGRMSELSEMDRQYYNVTSAVKLISEQIEGSAPIEITQEKESDNSYSASIQATEPASNELSLALAKFMVFGKATTESGALNELTGWGSTTIEPDIWWNDPSRYPERRDPLNLTLEIYKNAASTPTLSANAKANMRSDDGSFVIDISDGSASSNPFHMYVHLAPRFTPSDEILQADGSAIKNPTVVWEVTNVTRGKIAL